MDYTRSNTLILTKDAVVNGTNLPTSVFESKGIVGGSKKSKSKSKSSKNKKVIPLNHRAYRSSGDDGAQRMLSHRVL
jgi:hypothetical protein